MKPELNDKQVTDIFPYLKVVSPEEWIQAHAFTKHFEAKSRIFRREDAAMYGMFLISGSARITIINEDGNESVLNILSAGEVCSLLVLSGLSGQDYPGTLISESEVEVLYVLKSSFLRWLQVYEPIRSAIFGGLLDGTLRMANMLQERQSLPLEQRLARTLLRITSDEHPLVHTTHQELADDIGSVREVVSRALGHFQKKGWLETGRGWVKIINRGCLTETAM
ncbi:Crp/Fnr family transcriptional regulator [Paenibacillus lautus]|uniref:Crp/Fnr family transcriptional regulator n=1 Tax=Paenibacillus lautus TaxID=1401 RepID=UPI002DB57E05|nr:Crp/Fnr family transcriptional regulator [Paenibacillus lautus]MEC0205235.1 Crp/Fnr family transcriptional regulator [Paenibacillus lautus]